MQRPALLRAQAGLEYAFLLAMVLVASLSLAYFSFSESQASTRVSQIELATKQLSDAADLVYASGVGSKTTVRVYLPPGVNLSQVGGREVLFRAYGSRGQLLDVYRVTVANLTPASLPQGESIYVFSVEFLSNGNVSIYPIDEASPTPSPSASPTATPTPLPDPYNPLFYANQTNDTESGTAVLFSLNWVDNQNLGNYTFSFDNGTGVFFNDSAVGFSGTSNYSNVTKLVNQSTGSLIKWQAYGADAAGNVNNSQVYRFTSCGAVASANESNNSLSAGYFNASVDSQGKAAYMQWNNCSKFGGYNFTRATYYSPVFLLNHSQAQNVSNANWTWFQAATAGNASSDAYSGPRASFHFENDTKDSSRLNNTLSVNGNTTSAMYNSSCKVGGCLTFDGSNDYLNAPTFRSSSGQITVAAWVYHNSLPSSIQRYATVLPEAAVIRHAGNSGIGQLHFYLNLSGTLQSLRVDNQLAVGQWYHVVGTWNGTHQKLYKNGVEIGSATPSGTLSAATSLMISSNTEPMHGSLDEVHVWDYALNSTQVASLYSLENSGKFDHNTTNVTLQYRTKDYSFNDTGLVGWWDLGDEAGLGVDPLNRSPDLSGNGNDLTMGNRTANTQPTLNATACVVGNCLDFNRQSANEQYMVRNPFPNFPSTAITAAFWMRSNSSNSGTAFSYNTPPNNNEFRVYNYSNFQINVKGNGVTSGVSANDGLWHHVAATWRSSDGQAILYKDGLAVYSSTVSSGQSMASGGGLVLGQDQDVPGGSFETYQLFNGSLDDVKMWNRTLSATEIYRLYNGGAPTSSTGLERNWTDYSGELGGGSVDSAAVSLSAGRIAQYKANLKADSSNRSYSPFFLGANNTLSAYGAAPTPAPVKALATYFDSSSSNNVRYRTYDSENGWGSEQNAQNVGEINRPKHVLRANPRRNEMVLVTQDTGKNIKAQVWNGTGWNNLTTLSAAGAKGDQYRSFDVQFEQSGDAIVVYRKSGSTNIPYYTVWNGNSWGSEQAATSVGPGVDIDWIRLVARNNSNEMVLAVHATNDDVYAQNWNGNSWSSVTTAETNAPCSYQCFDVAYESSSGEALLAYREASTTIVRYRTYSGGSWSAQSNAGDVGRKPAWIRLASDPTSDRIILGVLDENSDLNAQTWSGSAWGSVSQLETSMKTNSERDFDIAYQANGTAVMVYSESGLKTPRYRLYTDPSWGQQQNAIGVGGEQTWISLAANQSGNELMAMVAENWNNHVSLQRWTGTKWVEWQEVDANGYPTFEGFSAAYRRA